MSTVTLSWPEANQRHLLAALAPVREALESHAARRRGETPPPPDPALATRLEEAAAALPGPPPALDVLVQRFGLSRFERDLLLLTAGADLDSTFAAACAAAQGGTNRDPTFSLALAALPEPHWSALSPAGPLRTWRMIEVGNGGALTTAPLKLDERVLHHLAGLSYLDERLVGLVRQVAPPAELAPSQAALAEKIARLLGANAGLPAVELCGPAADAKQEIAATAAAGLGLSLHILLASGLPTAPVEIEGLLRLWEREAAFSGSALLLDAQELDAAEPGREAALLRVAEELRGAVFVSTRERRPLRERAVLTFEVGRPAVSEQLALWRSALGPVATSLNGQVEAVVAQFQLSAVAIRSAARQVLGLAAATPGTERGDDPAHALWETCRVHTRPRLEALAQRIPPTATWDDLVLPAAEKEVLAEISLHVRQRQRVYEEWGFAAKSARGLGVTALFSGASGTGKTLAAEVLARGLRLDLYRIDLSSVVSKYIGETEKNLRRVFDAAEEGGAILLFDEADALFGKRSEVKDSHDRYANLEVSYLLQRMEAYRGLAILTTNLKDALDPAFLRRLRFIVSFPFPEAAERAEIWRRIFPVETPTAGLDPDQLARLAVSGGHIKNIALGSAFLAANDAAPVSMAHLLKAARRELAKLERPFPEAETRGWVA